MIIGIDISKYNLGWQASKAVKPISFVIQRASWSLYKDSGFDALLPEVQKIPIRGAYHYYSSGVSWKSQADLFLSVVKGKGFHFYVVDYEGAYNSLSARTIAEVAEMVKYIKAQTNQRCMVYFSPSIYNDYIKPFGCSNWAHQQDIWIAQYPWTLTQDPGKTSPAIPDGLPWRIWQYGGGDVNFTAGRHAGADYGGGLVGMDLNYFNGTQEEMVAWAGAIVEPTPVVPPVVPPSPAPSSDLYTFSQDNYYPRRGGGPLVLAVSRVRGKADNMTNYSWAALSPLLAKLNPTNKAAVGLIANADWGPTKGVENGYVKWIGLLWPGRNIVKVQEIVNGYGRVNGISVPEVGSVNPFDNPDVVSMVYDYNKTNGWGERTKPVYVPILGGPWWVDMGMLVSVDAQLPKSVKVTGFPGLNVRSSPTTAAPVVRSVATGQSVTIFEVIIGRGGLWGRVDGGYLSLRNNGSNWTRWKI